MLVSGWIPRSAQVPDRHYPNTSRNRLFPSQGTLASVLSNPAAISNGLWARFWNFTTTSPSVIVIARRGVDEVAEQVARLGRLVAVADANGQQAIQAAGHQRQLQVAVDLHRHRRGEGVHVEEVDPVLDVVLDEHPLGIAADQVGGGPGQLVGQEQGRLLVPQVGDGQLPERAVVVAAA